LMRNGITKLVEGRDLTRSEAEEMMNEIMSGKATEAQIAAFLMALRMKGETIEEITAFAYVMKEFCCQIHPKVNGMLVDTCGTGGDRIKTFNISTIASFVAAGAGVAVAKHGNRSVTSRCGSADVLEALGLNLKMSPALVEKSIEEIGIGFMFAPSFHPAMRYAINPRKELGIRTVFNLLGPLCNPANARAQLLGVYDEHLTEPLAHVLDNLGVERAMVVYGLDGLDEISTVGKTKMTMLSNGEVSNSYISPEYFGARTVERMVLEGSTAEESASIAFRILNGQTSSGADKDDPKRDIVLVNAAATIQIGGKAEDFRYGMELSRNSIDSGAAYMKLKALIKASDGNLIKLEELESKYG